MQGNAEVTKGGGIAAILYRTGVYTMRLKQKYLFAVLLFIALAITATSACATTGGGGGTPQAAPRRAVKGI
jgi:hypothetical protein